MKLGFECWSTRQAPALIGHAKTRGASFHLHHSRRPSKGEPRWLSAPSLHSSPMWRDQSVHERCTKIRKFNGNFVQNDARANFIDVKKLVQAAGAWTRNNVLSTKRVCWTSHHENIKYETVTVFVIHFVWSAHRVFQSNLPFILTQSKRSHVRPNLLAIRRTRYRRHLIHFRERWSEPALYFPVAALPLTSCVQHDNKQTQSGSVNAIRTNHQV